jgi:hypothetical protein
MRSIEVYAKNSNLRTFKILIEYMNQKRDAFCNIVVPN